MFLTPWTTHARALRFPFDTTFPALDADEANTTPTRVPRVEITPGAEAHVVVAEVAGVPADGVQLTAEKGVLSLTATAPKWAWKRSFSLPDDVDVDNISASLKDGLLTITLPRVHAVRPRQIRVEGA